MHSGFNNEQNLLSKYIKDASSLVDKGYTHPPLRNIHISDGDVLVIIIYDNYEAYTLKVIVLSENPDNWQLVTNVEEFSGRIVTVDPIVDDVYYNNKLIDNLILRIVDLGEENHAY